MIRYIGEVIGGAVLLFVAIWLPLSCGKPLNMERVIWTAHR
jgi:hypothetical protein